MPRRDNRTNEGVMINLKTYILLLNRDTLLHINMHWGFCCMLFTVDIVIFTFLFVCLKIVMLIIPKLLKLFFFTQTCMCTYTIIMEGADYLYLFRKSFHSCLSLKS